MRPDLDRPCRIMVAPNGAQRTRDDHPRLPMTPFEVAADARECLEAGATAIHLHARDADGRHSLDPAIYRRYLDAVREAVGEAMMIQMTTEAVGRYAPQEQMEAVRGLRPEAVSLALRELVPNEAAEAEAGRFFRWLEETGIAPQFILYDVDDVRRFHFLRDTEIIPGAPEVLFVLGRYLGPGEAVEPRALLTYLRAHDEACPWTVCAFGREETACLALAVCLGGHVRVGFENSLYLGSGAAAPDNAAKVREVAKVLDLVGRTRA